jgi:hypothetical protein
MDHSVTQPVLARLSVTADAISCHREAVDSPGEQFNEMWVKAQTS